MIEAELPQLRYKIQNKKSKIEHTITFGNWEEISRGGRSVATPVIHTVGIGRLLQPCSPPEKPL
jgi:hypothetical protein